jgi:hypothetical protein
VDAANDGAAITIGDGPAVTKCAAGLAHAANDGLAIAAASNGAAAAIGDGLAVSECAADPANCARDREADAVGDCPTVIKRAACLADAANDRAAVGDGPSLTQCAACPANALNDGPAVAVGDGPAVAGCAAGHTPHAACHGAAVAVGDGPAVTEYAAGPVDVEVDSLASRRRRWGLPHCSRVRSQPSRSRSTPLSSCSRWGRSLHHQMHCRPLHAVKDGAATALGDGSAVTECAACQDDAANDDWPLPSGRPHHYRLRRRALGCRHATNDGPAVDAANDVAVITIGDKPAVTKCAAGPAHAMNDGPAAAAWPLQTTKQPPPLGTALPSVRVLQAPPTALVTEKLMPLGTAPPSSRVPPASQTLRTTEQPLLLGTAPPSQSVPLAQPTPYDGSAVAVGDGPAVRSRASRQRCVH